MDAQAIGRISKTLGIARAHVEAILPVVIEALAVAGIERTDAIAVTNRPGLVGALSVGVMAALASLYPAWFAARKEPIDALRAL